VKAVRCLSCYAHADIILANGAKSSLVQALMNDFVPLIAQKHGGMKYEGMCHLLQTGW